MKTVSQRPQPNCNGHVVGPRNKPSLFQSLRMWSCLLQQHSHAQPNGPVTEAGSTLQHVAECFKGKQNLQEKMIVKGEIRLLAFEIPSLKTLYLFLRAVKKEATNSKPNSLRQEWHMSRRGPSEQDPWARGLDGLDDMLAPPSCSLWLARASCSPGDTRGTGRQLGPLLPHIFKPDPRGSNVSPCSRLASSPYFIFPLESFMTSQNA